MRRESRQAEPYDVFGRFDRMFEEWMRLLPFRSPMEPGWRHEDLIRVDEYQEGGNLVIRAELPGVDPEQDVELTVSEGELHISAQRKSEEKVEEKGYVRRELRYGSLTRTLSLPPGVSESDITATYKDGILDIRIPMPEVASKEAPKRIQIGRR